MIFVIDVGNTHIVLGVYMNATLLAHWRIGTNREMTADEIGMFIVNLYSHENLEIHKTKAAVVSSVVPHIMYSLEHAIRKYLKLEPMIISHNLQTGLKMHIENPKELGSDRIVTACAAYELYGGPIIIIDFGTATTFCAISLNGEYLGGVICPGVKIAAEALFQRAAKLPRIELIKPNNVIGKNTIVSMQSGIIYGYVGQVDYIVSRMKKEMCQEDIKVIATGGLARLIASESSCIDEVNGLLILEGLRIIYEKNKV